jgi:hypothetical protein
MEILMKKWNFKSKLLAALLPTVMLLAVNGEAQATVVTDFNYSGSMVTYDVTTTGTYDITAYGAQGGSYDQLLCMERSRGNGVS